MAQLPPDSHEATRSHSPSVAAPAWLARTMLPPPRTAPVKAILATFAADVIGAALRWRPVIGAEIPLVGAREVSCRVRAGEVARPARMSASPQGAAVAAPGPSVDRWVPRL